MTQFFDPFGHGKMEEKPKPQGKVVSIAGHEVNDSTEEEVDLLAEITEAVTEAQKEAQVTRAILILDGPDLGMKIRYIGDLDLSQVVGTLQIAGFVVMHEMNHED